ncbi:hypothetical protein FQN49_001322 [Arthroderma sp. PD_2]|nr:hypothetical protein FQN49_001322 [Arthroderma sp. PD_2]
MSSEDTKPWAYNLANLEKEVDALVHQYQSIKTPTTVLHLSKTPGYPELFNYVFKHHIYLIRSRSQAFEDAHITVYDKALLILTNNGNRLSHFGAIELFKDEVLGIRREDDIGKLDALFSKNIALRAILGHVTGWKKESGAGTGPEQPQSVAMTPAASRKEVKVAGIAQQGQLAPEPLTPPPSALKRELDGQLATMLKTFATAQLEHDFVTEAKNQAKYKAARFLSDSAENSLRHLRDHDPEHYMVPVLKQAFNKAQREIVEMKRGKKRSFDMSDKECPDHRVHRRVRCQTAAKEPTSRRRRRGSRGRGLRADCYRPQTS